MIRMTAAKRAMSVRIVDVVIGGRHTCRRRCRWLNDEPGGTQKCGVLVKEQCVAGEDGNENGWWENCQDRCGEVRYQPIDVGCIKGFFFDRR